VDAICINQEDNEEKSYQVESMYHIYAGSHNYLIYLGDYLDVGFTEVEAEDTLSVIRMLLDGQKREFSVSTKRIAEGIHAFMNSEWWQRFWTIQDDSGSGAIPRRIILLGFIIYILERAFSSC
jgi:hypothetical protein